MKISDLKKGLRIKYIGENYYQDRKTGSLATIVGFNRGGGIFIKYDGSFDKHIIGKNEFQYFELVTDEPKEPEPTLNPQEKNKQDLETFFIISAMKNTSEEEFITKALRKFVPNKGITVCFVGERSQSVLNMEMGFEVAVGDRLSSEYDRLVEYFIPKSGGVVKVLGETGLSESGAESEIITKTIDTRKNLPLNLLTIIKDLK